jgi:hypothetical protein
MLNVSIKVILQRLKTAADLALQDRSLRSGLHGRAVQTAKERKRARCTRWREARERHLGVLAEAARGPLAAHLAVGD